MQRTRTESSVLPPGHRDLLIGVGVAALAQSTESKRRRGYGQTGGNV